MKIKIIYESKTGNTKLVGIFILVIFISLMIMILSG